MTYEEIRIRLYEMADKKYQEFSSALIPGCKNMICWISACSGAPTALL